MTAVYGGGEPSFVLALGAHRVHDRLDISSVSGAASSTPSELLEGDRFVLRSCVQVKQQLDGRHIPKHLVDNHPNPPMLKIAFSQHSDLNIKFQSHRSRCAASLAHRKHCIARVLE